MEKRSGGSVSNRLKITGEETDCTEGQPKRLLPLFCFCGKLNEVPVGVPGREMGCTLRGDGCCGEVTARRPSISSSSSIEGNA